MLQRITLQLEICPNFIEKIVTEDKVTSEAVEYMYCNLSALHTLFVGIGEVR